MDFLTPPTAAFENLTITESLSPPTTSLENLAISGRNADKNKPGKQKHINPSRMPSREELLRLAKLTALITRWYGILKTCQSCIRHETSPSPGPSNNIVSADERLNKFPQRLSNRANFISFRLIFIGRRITDELSIMAEDKPEHREKLLLAKSYVQQRKNREEVLSIIKSVYTNY